MYLVLIALSEKSSFRQLCFDNSPQILGPLPGNANTLEECGSVAAASVCVFK